jgi:hypothetical protein
MSKKWIRVGVLGLGAAVLAGWLWWSPSAGPEPSASAPTAAAARPASSGNIHTAEDFNAWRPSVNLALPDCPQGPTVSPAGPPCVQPHFRKLPPFPDSAENNKTLAGIDADKDGVRDDVQWWIAEKFQADAEMRAAHLQAARAQQKLFTNPPRTSDESFLINRPMTYATLCVASLYIKQLPRKTEDAESDALRAALDQIEMLTQVVIFNTHARRTLYLSAERMMHGRIIDGIDVRDKPYKSFCN